VIFLDPAFWFWAPPLLAAITVVGVLAAHDRRSVVLLGGVALFLVALGLAATAGWAWVLRDGFGPDSVESGGMLAWKRFVAAFSPAFVSAAGEASVVAWAWLRKLRSVDISAVSAK
jgi:hypothetical protein